MPILTGSRIILMKSVKPFKRVIRAIRKNRVNIFVGIPSMYTLLANFKLPRILLHTPLIKLFNPLKFCISGAAALPEKTLRKFEQKFRVPLLEGYGLTEAAPVVTLNPLKGIRKAGSIGMRLARHLDIKIIDENGRELKHNAVGELIVRGPSVMQAYFNQPKATKETIIDGWLHTGDMAKVDEEGYFFIVGRKKEMVNVRGLNVYPREIEDVLYQHPAVKETAVIGVKDEHKGEVPKAFVVLKDNSSATERELIMYIRQKLAPYKIPKRVEFRKSLPKNSTGKILKRILVNEENDRK
jgi:long-chain acyl-CoA synthetase